MGALAAADPARALPALADAFGATFWVAFGLTAASLVAALALPGRPAQQPSAGADQPSASAERPSVARQGRHNPEAAAAHR